MRVWRQFKLLWSTYRKMILLYLLIVLLPAGGLLYYYFDRSTEVLEQQVTQSILKSVQQVKINIDYRLLKVSEMSDSLILNEELYENLARDPSSGTPYEQVEEERRLASIIRSLQGHDIPRIRLYVLDEKMYSGEHVNFFSLGEAAERPWYDEVIDRKGAIHWIPTRQEAFSDLPSRIEVLSVARMIRDPAQYSRIIGIMELNVRERMLSEIMSQAEYSPEHNTLYVLDPDGKIVAHADPTTIGTRLLDPEIYAELGEQASGILPMNAHSDPYFLIYDTLEQSGWKIVSMIPAVLINQANSEYNFASAIVLILSFLLLFILAAFLVFAYVTERMVQRLRHITSRLRDGGMATIDEGITNRRGIIIRLEKSVGHMLSTFQHLMEDNYQTKVREKEAHLRALQAQINPHFLYNALDAINWMALTRGAQDISRMLNTLAQYFRLSLSKGKDIVTVEDEMNLARAYLDIQQQRFHNFNYTIECNELILARLIPKMTIQPILENALLHGIQNKEGHYGHITITGEAAGEGFILTVTDDGAGMDEEKLHAIQAGLQTQTPSSYGLYNVMERLRLFTDDTGRLNIQSRPGEGTVVRIVIGG